MTKRLAGLAALTFCLMASVVRAATYEELCRAIAAHPNDRAAQDALAEYFGSHGQPERAEVIRLEHVIRAKGPETAAAHGQRQLLITQHGRRWVGALPAEIEIRGWANGFVNSVSVHGDDFLKDEVRRALDALDVPVRHLEVLVPHSRPWRYGLRLSVAFGSYRGTAALESLSLSAQDISYYDVAGLLSHMPQLQSLSILQTSGAELVQAIDASRAAPSLRSLHLNAKLSASDVRDLLHSRRLARLEYLSLRGDLGRGHDFSSCRDADGLPALRRLELGTESAASMLKLAQSPLFRRLHALSVRLSRNWVPWIDWGRGAARDVDFLDVIALGDHHLQEFNFYNLDRYPMITAKLAANRARNGLCSSQVGDRGRDTTVAD